MTAEQLDAVEKYANRRDEATTQILMLVKALREAWQERDKAVDCLGGLEETIRTKLPYHYVDGINEEASCEESIDYASSDILRLKKERDTARAEVERLRGIVETYDDRFATMYDEKNKEIENAMKRRA